jgi:ADP-ribose pyrophosphatase
VRELKEETGHYAAQWQALGYFFSAPGFSTEKMFLFLATQLTAGAATPEDDEAIHVEKIPLADALAKIESGEIVDAKSIVGILRVWKLMGM